MHWSAFDGQRVFVERLFGLEACLLDFLIALWLVHRQLWRFGDSLFLLSPGIRPRLDGTDRLNFSSTYRLLNSLMVLIPFSQLFKRYLPLVPQLLFQIGLRVDLLDRCVDVETALCLSTICEYDLVPLLAGILGPRCPSLHASPPFGLLGGLP